MDELEIIAAILGAGGGMFLATHWYLSRSSSSEVASPEDSVLKELEETKKQVSKSKFSIHVEKEGEELSSQGAKLFEQYSGLRKLLLTKFAPTEITYSRYASGIETSCLSIAQNLMHIKNVVDHLEQTKGTDPSAWETERAQMNESLKRTSEALSGLANLFVSLNAINTQEQHRPQLEQSMEEVRLLSERVKLYSKT
jgi:hypothetical protein